MFARSVCVCVCMGVLHSCILGTNAQACAVVCVCFMSLLKFARFSGEQNKEVTYAALAMTNPKQKAIYTSATLGRQRNKVTRPNEPTIYAQVSSETGKM